MPVYQEESTSALASHTLSCKAEDEGTQTTIITCLSLYLDRVEATWVPRVFLALIFLNLPTFPSVLI